MFYMDIMLLTVGPWTYKNIKHMEVTLNVCVNCVDRCVECWLECWPSWSQCWPLCWPLAVVLAVVLVVVLTDVLVVVLIVDEIGCVSCCVSDTQCPCEKHNWDNNINKIIRTGVPMGWELVPRWDRTRVGAAMGQNESWCRDRATRELVPLY